MDDLLRLPAVSRIHFIRGISGANTGMEWGNNGGSTVQNTAMACFRAQVLGVPT